MTGGDALDLDGDDQADEVSGFHTIKDSHYDEDQSIGRFEEEKIPAHSQTRLGDIEGSADHVASHSQFDAPSIDDDSAYGNIRDVISGNAPYQDDFKSKI